MGNPKLGPPGEKALPSPGKGTPRGKQQQQGAAATTGATGLGNEQSTGQFIHAQRLIAPNGAMAGGTVPLLIAASLQQQQAQGTEARHCGVPTGAAPGTILASLNALAASPAPIAPSPVLQLQSNFAQQQQHPFLNANFPLNPCMALGLERPQLRQKKNLRSGKWIPEEEEYALILIDLFEKGLVSDCENGTTMRAYLSIKLHCAPMRISKKFAGKGIGKMIYVRSKQCPAELETKKKAAEQKFQRAISSLSDYLLGTSGGAAAASLLRGMMLPPPGFAAATPAPFPIPTAKPIASRSHAEQLHESYIRALRQSAGEQAAAAANEQAKLAAVVGSTVAPANPVAALAAVLPTTMRPATSTAAVAAVAPVVNATGAPIKAANGVLSQPPVKATNGHVSVVLKALQPAPPKPNSQESKPRAADLPSGFAQSNGYGTNLETIDEAADESQDAAGPSDYFHRYLSKELGMLNDSSPEKAKELPKPAAAAPTVHDTTALFTAESYAIFAQESAIEASQHAAYHLQGLGASKYHQKDSLDVDGMLSMVSEHTFGLPMKFPEAPSGSTMMPAVKQEEKNSSNSKLLERKDDAKDKNILSELTPVERFVGSHVGGGAPNVVSEPSATESSWSAFGGSLRGSTSESNDSDHHTSSSASSNDDDSSDDESHCSNGPRRKKIKLVSGDKEKALIVEH